jgi:alcohol dehydrogenase class IV
MKPCLLKEIEKQHRAACNAMFIAVLLAGMSTAALIIMAVHALTN